VIKPDDLTGVDADLARTLIVMARTIAPCLDSLVDGEGGDDPKPRSDAIAVLLQVAKRARRSGVKMQQTGPSRVEYVVDASTFTADDRTMLRSLCDATTTAAALPLGSFPKPSRVVSRLFPEEC
jgi:hypothetical protein